MIKIDKRKGKFNLKDATQLDDIAYFLYIIQLNKIIETSSINKKYYNKINQREFKKKFFDGVFYKNANIYLRINKIIKLKKNINGKLRQ